MKEFWNSRYSEQDFAYGKEPNQFVKDQLGKIPPGKALFPAEGEGRNAVYAATLGWEVLAFDQSEAGRDKALQLAQEKGVSINYQVCDLNEFQGKLESFDALILVYAHFPAAKRKEFHQKLLKYLKPGGWIILEGFSKAHAQFNSVNEKAGGPKDPAMLFSRDELMDDFADVADLSIEEDIVFLEEGLYHVGDSAVIRLIGKK